MAFLVVLRLVKEEWIMKAVQIGLMAGFLLAVSSIYAQESGKQPLLQAQTDIVYLASDYLEGRETGTDGERKAAEYIAWRFAQEELQPKGANGAWYHPFTFAYKPNPHSASGVEREGKNVVAYLDNGAATTVIIGAHYDHLGYGEFSSLYTGERAIHNGADDNASGVALLFYLANRLHDNPKAKGNNYLFIAFSGEELGLVGSKKWVNDPTVDLGTVNYMLNMDMVGRLNEEKVLSVQGVGTSPAWKPALESIRVGGLKPVYGESGVGPSDHTSFYLQNLPVLHFFTGQHHEYHKPTDDIEKINFAGLLNVGDYLLALIEKLNTETKLTFMATKDTDNGREAANFKVTLGVMPDYVHAGTGMRVDSVIEGRVGDKAGMKSGDVIIRIGDVEVADIYAYMEGLAKFQKGDSTTIVVKRGDQEIELPVTFE